MSTCDRSVVRPRRHGRVRWSFVLLVLFFGTVLVWRALSPYRTATEMLGDLSREQANDKQRPVLVEPVRLERAASRTPSEEWTPNAQSKLQPQVGRAALSIRLLGREAIRRGVPIEAARFDGKIQLGNARTRRTSAAGIAEWSGLEPGAYRWRAIDGPAFEIVPPFETPSVVFKDGTTSQPGDDMGWSGEFRLDADEVRVIECVLLANADVYGRAPTDLVPGGRTEIRIMTVKLHQDLAGRSPSLTIVEVEQRVEIRDDMAFRFENVEAGRKVVVIASFGSDEARIGYVEFLLAPDEARDLGVVPWAPGDLTVRAGFVDTEGAKLMTADVLLEEPRPVVDLSASSPGRGLTFPMPLESDFRIRGLGVQDVYLSAFPPLVEEWTWRPGFTFKTSKGHHGPALPDGTRIPIDLILTRQTACALRFDLPSERALDAELTVWASNGPSPSKFEMRLSSNAPVVRLTPGPWNVLVRVTWPRLHPGEVWSEARRLVVREDEEFSWKPSPAMRTELELVGPDGLPWAWRGAQYEIECGSECTLEWQGTTDANGRLLVDFSPPGSTIRLVGPDSARECAAGASLRWAVSESGLFRKHLGSRRW